LWLNEEGPEEQKMWRKRGESVEESTFCLPTASYWFLAWLTFLPEDGGNIFLNNW
jgi:hypothetical protein